MLSTENMSSTILKKSKMNYDNHYFKTNWENIKNTWKGINHSLNKIILIQIFLINLFLNKINAHSNIPKILVSNDTTSAEPIEIANIFNNFFTFSAAKTKESIKYSHRNFFSFLKNRSDDSFFLSSTEKHEVINIVSSLDSNKSTGTDSIPTKILKLLKTFYFYSTISLTFLSWELSFHLYSKYQKVVPIHKKQSKL